MKYIEITNKKGKTENNLKILKRNYISIVSHKLLSPLTIIKWNIELIRNKKDECNKFKEQFDAIETSIKKLETYSDILMKVAEAQELVIDEKEIEEKKEKFSVDICSLIQKIITSYKDVVKNKALQVDINCDVSKNLIVNYKKDYVLDIIDSIVKNAVDYSDENSKILINCKFADVSDVKMFSLDKNNYVIFSVESEGLTIDDDEVKFIGESFFRGIQAKSSQAKGYGLSLYLAKILLEGTNGKMFISRKSKKTKFTVVFYVKNIV